MREFKFINFNKGKNYYLIEINRPDQLNAINKETIIELKDSSPRSFLMICFA